MERSSKKKALLWKKAIFHFSLCFVMGFFTGFAPTGRPTATNFSSSIVSSPQPSLTISPKVNKTWSTEPDNTEEQQQRQLEEVETNLVSKRLVIVVTPISSTEKYSGVFLRRLANTIKLVSAPLLWIVVESESNSDELSKILRKTGIMYRHLVFKENFTETEAELDHERNVALKHIEQHRLSGIVHFAGLNNVYDVAFFDQLRDIEMFGTWPMALLSANKQKVKIEGPVCDSSQVIGWHLKKIHNENENDNNDDYERPAIHISSFAFNSSILWDPERWGRPSSVQHTSQNSIKFVKEVVLEDETKIKGIPPQKCSKIMLWSLQLPKQSSPHDKDQTANNTS